MSERIFIPLFNFNIEPENYFELNEIDKIISYNDFLVTEKINSNKTPKYWFSTIPKKGEEPRRTLDRILIIFKLFKDSLVLSNIIFNEEGKHIDLLPHYTYWEDLERDLNYYIITAVEKPIFKIFWNKYNIINNFNFAVNRFHLADYNVYLKYRLINYIECLEYLFVPDSSSGEISYKFRTRGTIILGIKKTLSEREIIFNQLKEFYTLRSAIVHGNKKNEKKIMRNKKWEDSLKKLRFYCRQAIISPVIYRKLS